MAPATGRNYLVQVELRNAALKGLRKELDFLREQAASLTLHQLNLRRQFAKDAYAEFQEAHKGVIHAITRVDDVAEAALQFDEGKFVQTEIMTIIEEALSNRKENEPRVPSMNEIRIQKFNGDVKEWVEWRARFEDNVLRTGLSAGQKIDLLLDALQGDAKIAAGSAGQRDDVELKRIWGKLVTNYDNPYQQVKAHVDAIINLPVIKKASPEAIRHLINVVEENLRLLARYDVNSHHWDNLLAIMLIKKLDSETKYMWRTSPHRPQFPNLESLFKFLNQRARALEDAQNDDADNQNLNLRRGNEYKSLPMRDQQFDLNKRRTELKPYTRDIATKFRPKSCFVCGHGDHLLAECQQFRLASPAGREEIARRKMVCRRCLRGSHHIEACRATISCMKCGDRSHHALLCLKSENASKLN